MDLSVVITMYNTEAYASQCLDSVASLPGERCEIIVVDDGSTDGTSSICREWASGRDNAHFISQHNSGVSVARNVGIGKASAPYIAFLDGDDWIEPDLLMSLLDCALEHDLDIAIGAFSSSYRNRIERSRFFNFKRHVFSQDEKKSLVKNCMVTCDFGRQGIPTNCGVPWGKLYRSSFIHDKRLGFVPGLKRMQDSVFNISAYAQATSIEVFDLPFYNYRISSQSSVNKCNPHFRDVAMSVLKNMRCALAENGLFDSCRGVYTTKEFLLLLETIRLAVISDGSLGLLGKRKKIAELSNDSVFREGVCNCDPGLLTRKENVQRQLIQRRLYMPFCITLMIRRSIKKKSMFA
ncbi:glycosyltransferase family 2 protein [Parafannyhessea umbonata]|uniref:Glycosyl transferase family 2 n=1 Tax=Parafannyhessea umbonata TaxID=604330 RepID=A0A1H9NH38_9ACTN|nr:glycosyltransferase [Parafannyhessea umbonata]SER35266.1 Glycosyl transferase family 2 [Parafannyhessea umbonata]